jgi:hypothetical protein
MVLRVIVYQYTVKCRPFRLSLAHHEGARCGEEGMSTETANDDTGDSNPLEIVDRPSEAFGKILPNIWTVIPHGKERDGLDGWLDGSASVDFRLETTYVRTSMRIQANLTMPSIPCHGLRRLTLTCSRNHPTARKGNWNVYH